MGEVKKSIVIAKDDYELDNHTWTKGKGYEFIRKENSVTVASNEAQLSWVKERERDLLELFKKSEEGEA